MNVFRKECDGCGNLEERVFFDSWTGLELCNTCVAAVINQVTPSPYTEGDNLKTLLKDLVGSDPRSHTH